MLFLIHRTILQNHFLTLSCLPFFTESIDTIPDTSIVVTKELFDFFSTSAVTQSCCASIRPLISGWDMIGGWILRPSFPLFIVLHSLLLYPSPHFSARLSMASDQHTQTPCAQPPHPQATQLQASVTRRRKRPTIPIMWLNNARSGWSLSKEISRVLMESMWGNGAWMGIIRKARWCGGSCYIE